MIITIDGEFTDLNKYINAERTNRFKASKIKKEETERVFFAIKALNLSAYKGNPTEITFTWFVKDKKKDADNIAFAKKFILDGMVAARIIPSDNRRVINRFYDKVYVDKDYQRVVVEIS